MQKELLRMENIVKTFPGVKALNNAAITVHAGEVMGFMGENGAGKSTLMNVLGGVFPQTGLSDPAFSFFGFPDADPWNGQYTQRVRVLSRKTCPRAH